MIISESEKHFDKVSHPFMIPAQKKVATEGANPHNERSVLNYSQHCPAWRNTLSLTPAETRVSKFFTLT